MGIYKGQTPKDITDQVFGPLISTTGTVHDFTPYHVFTMFYRQCKSSLQYKSLYKNLSTITVEEAIQQYTYSTLTL